MRNIIIIFLFFPILLFSQKTSHLVQVKKEPFLQNNKIVINYDIISPTNSKYDVKVNVLKDGIILNGMNSFTGDIGSNITKGKEKTIKWSVLNDYPEIKDDDMFSFEIIAKEIKLSLDDSDINNDKSYSIAFLSFVAPGAPSYKVSEKNKPYWLKTILFYSGIVGGVVMNNASVSHYDSYNQATSLNEIEDYYQKANSSRKISDYCFTLSGTIMIQDFFSTISKVSKFNKKNK